MGFKKSWTAKKSHEMLKISCNGKKKVYKILSRIDTLRITKNVSNTINVLPKGHGLLKTQCEYLIIIVNRYIL